MYTVDQRFFETWEYLGLLLCNKPISLEFVKEKFIYYAIVRDSISFLLLWIL